MLLCCVASVGPRCHVGVPHVQVEGLEKERDFYFGKLRDIEILMQAYQGPDADVCKQIFTILCVCARMLVWGSRLRYPAAFLTCAP
jgi:hypothetical protein